MNLMTIIYFVGVLAVGFIAGLIVELGIDSNTINELREHNNKLKLENAQLRREAKPQTIEVLDRRSIEAGELFKPF